MLCKSYFALMHRKYIGCKCEGKAELSIGGFHAISGDTNNNGEMNKCWWTNKAS